MRHLILKIKFKFAGLAVWLFGLSLQANIIVVNTTNNVSPAAGETNLVQALQLAQDGDAIHFKLPGAGPFYLLTPPLAPDNGYPAITRNNLTIDGYSQPGAIPNSNPILSSNNAQLQIVLDSRGGGLRVEDIPGYSLGEGFVDILSQYQTLEDASREGRLRDVDALLSTINGTNQK